MNAFQIAVLAVFFIMTIVGYSLMRIDKRRAVRGEFRIKERTLFLVALLFGGVGSTLAMFLVRHKTKHWYFVIGMPLLAALSLFLTVYLFVILA